MFKSPHPSIRDQQFEARSGGPWTLEQSEWEAEMIPITLNKELDAVGRPNPFSGKGRRNLLLGVLRRQPQLFLTPLHKVPILRGFSALSPDPVRPGEADSGGSTGGFVWPSPIRWSLKESPHGRSEHPVSLPSQPWFTASGARGLHFPFMMYSDSPSLLQTSYLHFSPPPFYLPPSTSMGSCCNVSPSSSLAPPRPAHQAPAGSSLSLMLQLKASKAVFK